MQLIMLCNFEGLNLFPIIYVSTVVIPLLKSMPSPIASALLTLAE